LKTTQQIQWQEINCFDHINLSDEFQGSCIYLDAVEQQKER